jgi:hypothetical protein
MLHGQSRSWIVALLVVAGSLVLQGRATAQNPPPTGPDEESGDTAKPPSAETRPQAAEAKPPETAPKRSPRSGDVQKVFVIKNVHVRPLAEVLAVFPATITFSRSARTTALGVSAPPAVMAAIEETIKRLDVPKPSPRNIELTGDILEALPTPAEPTSLPSELQGVVAQLKRTFGFAAYRLADTLFVRAREEQGLETNGTSANDFVGLGRLNYSLSVRTAFVTAAEGGAVVHLDGMSFAASNPKLGRGRVGVSGDIDIRVGQRVVVGNTGLGTSGNAIILVLSAKVVD